MVLNHDLRRTDVTVSCNGPVRASAPGARRSRLVKVSNRVVDQRDDQRLGGLAVALAEARALAGRLWFGWSGAAIDDTVSDAPAVSGDGRFDIATIDLTRADLAGFYDGIANQCLWPLLHGRTDLVRFEGGFLDRYKSVNRDFAKSLVPLLRPDDIIRVHDFHLLQLGAGLRRLGVSNRIGFFLHVPFPGPEIIAVLPHHCALFRQVLACVFIGFQTDTDLNCFRAYARKELNAPIGADIVISGTRRDREEKDRNR